MGVEWSREEIIQRGQKKYVTMSWLPTYNCEYNITFLFLLGILISPKKRGIQYWYTPGSSFSMKYVDFVNNRDFFLSS